jgi:predicted nucleic acid-binding protein
MTTGSKESWGFDSNIIIYLLDDRSPFYKKTKKLFNSLLEDGISFKITQQNIIEIERVYISFYKQKPKDVVDKIEDFLEAFQFTIVTALPSTVYAYHRILKRVGKHPLDVYLATTYLDNRINKIFTANEKDFRGIPKFKAVNPYK